MGCIRAAGGLFGIVCLLISVGGCAGNGKGLDANGNPLSPGSGGNAPLSADFNSIQENIFTPICSVCHVGAAAPEGLRLDAADSYNLLVSVPSTEVPSILRVKPGDPDNSYIIQKLEGHAAVGARMPFGGPYLSTATVAFIRQWITDGALPATMTTPATMTAAAPVGAASLAVATTAPATNDVLSASPPQVMIGFSKALDATRIDAGAARIERLADDGSSPAETVPAAVTIPAANPQVLMLWPKRALPAGHYQVVLRGGLMNDPADRAVTQFTIEASP
jgi:hypothetical protein